MAVDDAKPVPSMLEMRDIDSIVTYGAIERQQEKSYFMGWTLYTSILVRRACFMVGQQWHIIR